MHSPNSTSPKLSSEPSTSTLRLDAPTQPSTEPTPLLSPALEKSLLPENVCDRIKPLEWSDLDTIATVQLLSDLHKKVLKETQNDTEWQSQVLPRWCAALSLLLTEPSWLSTEERRQSWSVILLGIREVWQDARRRNADRQRKDETTKYIQQSMTRVEIPAPSPKKMSEFSRKSMERARLTWSPSKRVWTGPKSPDTDHMARHWAQEQGSLL